jgi:NhaP-type Na+/H+ or K+/H+ antiporter
VTGVAVIAAAFAAYALLAARLDRAWISAPMVFVATGFLLGPSVLGLVEPSGERETLLHLTELTLAILLFADAATVRLKRLREDAALPGRLLGIGLPLTIALGTGLAALILGVPWAVAALIGTILAPTDAALGLAVVTDRAVPVRIRRTLNVESGLNDGIATPFVSLFLTIVATEEAVRTGSWVVGAAIELGLAVVAALVVGGLGGLAFATARARSWTTPVSEELAVLSLAVLSYVGAVAVGGNGFVAAFAGGLVFAFASSARDAKPGDPLATETREAVDFTETVGLFASFVVWVIFGALFVGPVLTRTPALEALIYAVASLTLIRMLPVAIALLGLKLRRDTIAFIGWFGPRGLASVVFSLIAFDELARTPVAPRLLEVATLTILGSVLLHGVTARPLAAIYGRRVRADPDAVELVRVSEPRVRRKTLAGGQSDRRGG